MMSMIYLQNFKKIIGKTTIFDGISYSFNDEGFYTIYGPNGCGKTTFLLIIGLYDLKYGGSFKIDEIEVSSLGKKKLKLLQNEIVYIGSKNDLLSFLNVEENLNISGKKHLDNNIKKILNKNVDSMSGGESQLISFYQKINLDAKIFLFDESTNMLDQKNKILVLETIKNISKKALCIMATHDEIVKNYCDKILYMK